MSSTPSLQSTHSNEKLQSPLIVYNCDDTNGRLITILASASHLIHQDTQRLVQKYLPDLDSKVSQDRIYESLSGDDLRELELIKNAAINLLNIRKDTIYNISNNETEITQLELRLRRFASNPVEGEGDSTSEVSLGGESARADRVVQAATDSDASVPSAGTGLDPSSSDRASPAPSNPWIKRVFVGMKSACRGVKNWILSVFSAIAALFSRVRRSQNLALNASF